MSRAPRLQAVAEYLSLQNKLSILTSAQSAGWMVALLFAMTMKVGWPLVKLAVGYSGIVWMTTAQVGYLS